MNFPTPTDELNNPKKPRASKPKVKTGCQTCKKRRVKCDETKPECLRCSNFGRKCEGYPSTDDKPEKTEPVVPVVRKLLSKPTQVTEPVPKAPISALAAGPLARVGSSRDAEDDVYICYFRDYTAIEIAGGFNLKLWSVIIVQACDNPSIRQLVIATGALSMAMSKAEPDDRRYKRDGLHQFALQQYGEALAGLQEMVAAGQESLRTTLISALLIFCFENLQGDVGRAIMQIQSVVDMFVKRIASDPSSYYFPRSKALGTQANGEIEAELLTAFIRLDRPTLEFSQRQSHSDSIPRPKIFTSLFSSEQLEIPSDFADIAEATIYLEDIIFRVFPTRHIEIACTEDEAENPSVFPDFNSVTTLIIKWSESVVPNMLNSGLSLRLARWYDAFSPLLNHSMTPAGHSMFLAAATLHVRALAMDLLVSGLFSSPFSTPTHTPPSVPSLAASSPRVSPTPVSENSDMFPIINAILSFSQRLVAHPDFHRGFVFDIGTMPWLVEVLVLCPDRGLKQKAMDILRSMAPRREGVWDSQTIVGICEDYLEKIDGQIDTEMIDPRLMSDNGRSD